MTQDLIPFGKHKGKPLEMLAEDKEYTAWLLAQPWFKAKYQNIYTVVINNFRTPVDTPEHNEMQVKFLNLDYSLRLALFLEPELFYWNSENINRELIRVLSKSIKSRAVIINKIKEMRGRKLLEISTPTLENGYDVSYALWYGVNFNFLYEIPGRDDTFAFNLNTSRFLKIIIEIKPSVGDDFPSILRQMKTSMPIRLDGYKQETFYCLLIRDYIGEGASKDQFIQFFQSQGYRVVFTNDIEKIILPQAEEDFNPEID